MIYFITVNYYSSELISELICSIQTHQNVSYQVIIINNSTDDLRIHELRGDRVLVLEAGSNLGFGRACNLGLNWVYQQDNQATVWIINPDTYLAEQALDQVPQFLTAYPQISILGTAIYEPDGKLWFSGGRFIPQTGAILDQDLLLDDACADWVASDWVTGCSCLINLKNFADCPYFDPTYFLYYEDFDFCQRYASQGHLIGVTKKISVFHRPSSITNRNLFTKLKHSTYSYLITLENYASKTAFVLRTVRLLSYACVLVIIQPQAGLGKLAGFMLYLRQVINFGKSNFS